MVWADMLNVTQGYVQDFTICLQRVFMAFPCFLLCPNLFAPILVIQSFLFNECFVVTLLCDFCPGSEKCFQRLSDVEGSMNEPPLCNTRIKSQYVMVESRCAIAMDVRPSAKFCRER